MGTSPRTGLVTQPTQPKFFNQSQLVFYRLLFISHRFFSSQRHWNPETLEQRVEAPGHWNLGTLEPRVSVYLSRSTPRLITTFSQFRDVVSFYVHMAARATFLSRRRAAAKSTPLTRRGAAAKPTPLTRRGAAARSTTLTAPVVAILSLTDRGHHVPALTAMSGERGVGFDVACLGTSGPSCTRGDISALELLPFIYFCFASFVLPPWPLGLAFLLGSWLPSEVYQLALLLYWDYVVSLCSMSFHSALLYGRRPGQPSSSSLARRAYVHFDFVFWLFLNYRCAPGPSGDRGDTPRWGLMAGTAACCCPFSFPVQPQSTELPATTEGRWRRRHLSPGHKAGLLTVLLMCTGCAFQVTPGVEKGVSLCRATNPRTGGYHKKNWTLDSDTLAVPFFFDILYGILVLFGAFMCLLCL